MPKALSWNGIEYDRRRAYGNRSKKILGKEFLGQQTCSAVAGERGIGVIRGAVYPAPQQRGPVQPHSKRQTIREIEVNVAYRWPLGLDMMDPVPHFSTFEKNHTRRFRDTDLFEQILAHILEQCMDAGLVDSSYIFVNATYIKVCAKQ